jgi:hypothetical protein
LSKKEIANDPLKSVRENLKQYIKVCGLIGFKDYYMKVKTSQITNIPAGLTKEQYLQLAKEVYESRASILNSKYFGKN